MEKAPQSAESNAAHESEEIMHEAEKSGYNFVEIEKIKPGMLEICRQLKEKLGQDYYEVLISDEISGRIPTLVMRKVIKSLHPDSKIETKFVAAGQDLMPHPEIYRRKRKSAVLNNEEKTEYWSKLFHKNKNLMVTEYIGSGSTFEGLFHMLEKLERQSGKDILKEIDIATVSISVESVRKKIKEIQEEFEGDFNINFIIGDVGYEQIEGLDGNYRLAGVSKNPDEYDERPILMEKAVKKFGKEKAGYFSHVDKQKLYGEEDYIKYITRERDETDPATVQYNSLKNETQLSDEEAAIMHQNIAKARQDVNLLAEEVIREIWPAGLNSEEHAIGLK